MKKFLALISVVIIFFAGCSNEPTVEVTTEKILSADTALTLTHEGKISLSNEKKIFSPVSGSVVEKYFEDGDDVTERQPLFKIGSFEEETELLQTKAALAEAMTNLTKELAQKKPVDEQQAEIAELQERVKILEEKSAAGMIYAPVAGQIGINNARLSTEVAANETVLATLGRKNPAVVRFEISPEEKKFLTESPPKVSLKFIDGMAYNRPGRLNFPDATTAEAIFDNPDELLLLGNTVQIELDGVKISNVLLVPERAIQQRDGENFVFVDSDKKAALKKVSLGGRLGNNFIVNDGLKAGDSVVVEGLTNLREGTPLKEKIGRD